MFYLNDLAMMCNLGNTAQAVRENLLVPDQPLPVRESLFSSANEQRVGRVEGNLAPLPEKLARFDCRNNRLAQAALRMLGDTLEPMLGRYGAHRIGVVLGTSTAGIDRTGEAVTSLASGNGYPEGFDAAQGALGNLAETVALLAGVKGPAFTVSTACSSGGNAVLSARRLLRLGLCDAVITGGVDTLCDLTLEGFAALEAVSGHLSRPWEDDRDGINIGEAATLFILSGEQSGVALMGGAASSDAHHISAPHPQGRGAIAAMQGALRDAGLRPAHIGYVNLHGTGTPHNDAMEAQAVNAVLGGAVPCSTTKCFTGHTLGASAALELGVCCLLLQSHHTSRLPPMPVIRHRDNTLAAVNLVETLSAPAVPPQFCLSNSFAFGGSNVSMIVGRLS